MPDIYVSVPYDQYKDVEDQLSDFEKLEHTHVEADGSYHKSFRLKVGDTTFEFHGPTVRQPGVVQ